MFSGLWLHTAIAYRLQPGIYHSPAATPSAKITNFPDRIVTPSKQRKRRTPSEHRTVFFGRPGIRDFRSSSLSSLSSVSLSGSQPDPHIVQPEFVRLRSVLVVPELDSRLDCFRFMSGHDARPHLPHFQSQNEPRHQFDPTSDGR